MNIKDFYELVELKKEPDVSMLLKLQLLTKKYPFFQAGLYTYIKCLHLGESDNFSSELNRLAPFIMDRKALFYYVMSAEYKEFQKKSGHALPESRTNVLISAFFETLDNTDEQRELEHAIINSSMASLDYFSYLESSVNTESGEKVNLDSIPSFSIEDIDLHGKGDDEVVISDVEAEIEVSEEIEPIGEVVQMKHQGIIDSFITKAQDKENLRITFDPSIQDNLYDGDDVPLQDETEEELDDDFFFTQTLANIYIKQKKYNRAYEIIKRLSLNYPEKNIYFADQLSFLEKVIKNSNKNK
ncbi:hypothetical protein CLV62_107125 [Dysgonomonas alginatilytica]|uniref:Tetratricopeptide repeat protein n=1 Tax=Dysgonomonas alginatilytica TaxID=1605892 RepID=A0A2V3PSX6_9BACT|nr:hypothetical protein [Dysgonomonas alginatilytica]PXV65528.1 hypothetical protein CLV62_107125 [Dysgonomonas alginatilytica]